VFCAGIDGADDAADAKDTGLFDTSNALLGVMYCTDIDGALDAEATGLFDTSNVLLGFIFCGGVAEEDDAALDAALDVALDVEASERFLLFIVILPVFITFNAGTFNADRAF
jgi:hypothetical protein